MAIFEQRSTGIGRALEAVAALALVAVVVALIRALRGAPFPSSASGGAWNGGAPWPALDGEHTATETAEGPLATPVGASTRTPSDDIDLRVGQRPPTGGGVDEHPTGASTDHPTVAVAVAWAEPVDGRCPPGYPVKAKLGSGIYHQPGGAMYDRTKPDRCYPSAEAAEADGLRAAKR